LGDVVAVAAGSGTDAQELYLKQVVSPDGQSQQQSCSPLALSLKNNAGL